MAPPSRARLHVYAECFPPANSRRMSEAGLIVRAPAPGECSAVLLEQGLEQGGAWPLLLSRASAA